MRLGAVFIAVCMVVIAACVGAIAYLSFGFAPMESVIVALAVLTALALCNAVSARLNVRAAVSSQLSDLSRRNFETVRQVGDMGRRVAALETRMDQIQQRPRPAPDALAAEMGELSSLVKQLAETVAANEARVAEFANCIRAADAPMPPLAASVPPAETPPDPPVDAAAPATAPVSPPAPPEETRAAPAPVVPMIDSEAERLAVIREAVDANRVDLYLQPIVTLPQRKVRYYEATSRLRTDAGDVLQAADFIALAQRDDLMAKIDNLVVFRCVQVVRRLLLKNREIGLFCNVSLSTLTDAAVFQHLLDFLDANRAIAPSVILEFTQGALRAAGPIENESLSALADRGFRFSLDNLQDLRIEPRDLAARGFRFVKVPGSLLLKSNDAASDIHPADLADLLGRFGIDLVAEKIESETTVVDLLDYDVRFGQGFLFSPPRPVRAEALQGVAERADAVARETSAPDVPPAAAAPVARGFVDEPNGSDAGHAARGLAQLARGVASRI